MWSLISATKLPAGRGCGGFFLHFKNRGGLLHFFGFAEAALGLDLVELFDGLVEAVCPAGLVQADVLDGFVLPIDGFGILLVVSGFDEGVVGRGAFGLDAFPLAVDG